ncbi:hypothetical protein EJP82_25185 [Paenibacillus anaericanus]|uniref:Uncharacterized protein n=1 Tax=Paenibacillus anaericanus TaxID=170367 RepID=A0A433XYZ9_9BACL|nr:hypothetical protein [Paenibacillus anaericanus]RUT40318.1 hypothetical protein EJP82_25185 [Paenibacillus anaericanus]
MKKILISSLAASILLSGTGIQAHAQGQKNLVAKASSQQVLTNTTNKPGLSSTERGSLASFKKVADLTTKQIFKLNPEKNISSLLSYHVSLYSISYLSVQKGKPVVLSGLVTIPKGKVTPSF